MLAELTRNLEKPVPPRTMTTYSAIALSWPNALHTATPAGNAASSINSTPVATDCTSFSLGAGGYSARQ